MSVYKPPKSPFYHFDFQFKGQRFHGSTGCKAERDAKRFEAREREKAALGGGLDEVTVDRGFGLWWQAVGEHLAAWKTEESRVATLVEELGGTRLISSLTLRDFDTLTAKLKARPLSPATVNRHIQLTRRVFLWLAEEGRGYRIPKLSWKKMLAKEPKGRVRELSVSEEGALFETLPKDLSRLVEFAMLSGQRKAELVNLAWDTVDFDREEASIILKGGAPHTFPLTDRMIAILKDCPRVEGVKQVFTYQADKDAPPSKVTGKVVRLKGNRYPFSKQGWSRKWRRALEDAGVSNFRFHDLRHTAATRLVRASGSLVAAQGLLGHTEIGTTARYAHATRSDIRAAMLKSQSPQDSRNSTEQGNVIALKG